MTINVSNLWRNPEQWAHLQTEIVPALAADGALRAWSAGCSYGAEAYTLAAVCRLGGPVRAHLDPRHRHRPPRHRARAWRRTSTPRTCATPRPPPLRGSSAAKTTAGGRSPSCAPWSRFELGDLLRLRPPVRAYDLVLCRNTVIYFTEDVRDALHERLATALRPGGVLVVGATERVTAPEAIGLRAVAPFTYIKA